MTLEAKVSWRIQLFQGLRVQRGDKIVDRFETRRAASLLAYLAFYPHRVYPREEIAEMLWPDEEPDVTRLRLRQVLNTIRRALDSPDGAHDGILLTDRTFIRINADALTTDVGEFENLRKAAAQTEDATRRAARLQQAIALYEGDLLPGNYDDWVQLERRRLQKAHRDTLLLLACAYGDLSDTNAALECARRVTEADSLDEEAHETLIRLTAQAGRPVEAMRQYLSLEQALWKELRALPSERLQALAAAVRAAKVPIVSAPARTSSVASLTATSSSREACRATVSAPEDSKELPAPDFSLNQPLTLFFGRQQEIADLTTLLHPSMSLSALPAIPWPAPHPFPIESERPSATRLVTLVGPGGSGKTRLAQEVARALQSVYRQAMWFVSLVEVTDATRIFDRIAESVYPNDGSAPNSLERLTETFRRRPVLLVLDNFEQLTTAGGAVIRALLERIPTLRCLVTSRQALQIAGEHRVDVLPLPTPGAREDWEQAQQSPSLQLFEDRARSVVGDFALTPNNRAEVAALCRYLEGFPLALELAAGWMGVLSPDQLLKRLDDRFGLLVTQQSDTPARQRSLYATIEWSYTHLPAEVQAFFAALYVFHDGWTLEAAEAVIGEPQAVVYLAQLQRHSLIFRKADPSGGRMRMLETLRDFAGLQLEAERRNTLRRNQARYYVALAECAAPHLIGPEQSHWLDRLHTENDNFRAALHWCLETDRDSAHRFGVHSAQADKAAGRENGTGAEVEPVEQELENREKTEIGLRFVAALWRFWDIRCHYEEAEVWIETLLARSSQADQADTDLQSRALEGAGGLALSRGHHETAQQRLEHSVRGFAKSGDKYGMARALSALAATLRDKGDLYAARPLFEQSLSIMRQHKDTFGMARALGGLGIIAALEKDVVCAHSLLEQSAAMYRICGHRKGLAWCHYERGLLAGKQGDMDIQLQLFQEGLLISRALNDSKTILFACFNIGYVYQRQEAWPQACAIGQEALRYAQESGHTLSEIMYTLWQGDLAYEQQYCAQAVTHYQEGLQRSIQAQSASGLCAALDRIACAALLQNDLETAVCLHSAARRYAEAEPLTLPNTPRHITRSVREQLQQTYEDAVFLPYRALGEQMTLEESVDCAAKIQRQARDSKPLELHARPPKHTWKS